MYPETSAPMNEDSKTRAAFFRSMEEYHRNNESQGLREQLWRLEREGNLIRDFLFKEIDALKAEIEDLKGQTNGKTKAE